MNTDNCEITYGERLASSKNERIFFDYAKSLFIISVQGANIRDARDYLPLINSIVFHAKIIALGWDAMGK